MKPEISDKSLNEFKTLYAEIESFYKGKIMTELERKTVLDLKKLIIQSSKKGFDAVDLSRFESHISILLMTLGELATERMKQMNFLFRYNKWKKHREWNSAKEELGKRMEKVLVGDIENEVNSKMFADLSLQIYLESIADYLTSLHRDGTMYVNSLKDRIKVEMREFNLKQE